MNQDKELNKKIEEILINQDFLQLESYENSQTWESLSQSERLILAQAFVKWGEFYLKSGENCFLDKFRIANQIAGEEAAVYYLQGCALSHFETNFSYLHLAKEYLEKAISCDPECFEAQHMWANVQVDMGIFLLDTEYLQEAHKKYTYLNEVKRTLPHLMWDWALCWHHLGKISGEAFDYRMSLDKYKLAVDEESDSPSFWNDYGNAFCGLSYLLGKTQLLNEAIECYHKSIKQRSDFFPALLNLGCLYERSYVQDPKEEYFQTAESFFTKAAQVQQESVHLWGNWANLYLASGKNNKNLEIIQLSLEKFALANQYQPKNSFILSRWAEALTILGTNHDRLDYLKSSEQKFIEALEYHPDNSEIWGLYGTCLNELGRYFSDEAYYHQAVEKFQHAISIKQTDSMLWYGLAVACFALGEMKDDIALIEQSIKYCSRAMEFGGQNLPQFWNDWGVSLMKLSEMTNDQKYVITAIEKFEQAIVHLPLNDIDPEYLYNYGCALDFLGDFTEDVACYEKAIKVLAKALDIDPSYTNARYNLALAYSHLGEATSDIEALQKACEHFQVLLDQDYEDEMSWNDWGLALITLAQLMEDTGIPHRSLAIYEQAESKLLHSVALGNVVSYYNLGCLQSLIGNYDTAFHYIEKADTAGALPCLEDLMHDEWLEGLRQTINFKNFISQIYIKKPKH